MKLFQSDCVAPFDEKNDCKPTTRVAGISVLLNHHLHFKPSEQPKASIALPKTTARWMARLQHPQLVPSLRSWVNCGWRLRLACVSIFAMLTMLLGAPLNRFSHGQEGPKPPTFRGTPVVTDVEVDIKEINRGPKPIQAPPNHAILSNTLNGWQFVPIELKKEYDTTLKRLESLQVDVDAGNVSAKDAIADLAELKRLLQSLRTKIEASRVHVSGAQLNEQTETIEFELGAEKRLAITANHVRILGWQEKKVKVELKKIVLSVDDQPVDQQLQAIQIVHERGATKFAGRTDAEWEASEAEFMAKSGATMTAEQLENRRKLVDNIRASFAIHRELLGKELDQLSVAGMDYQSNPMITTKVNSEGGDGQWGSARQRYAEMTIHVPPCTSVCVRGAKRGLLVEDLVGSLTIVDEDSTDSDDRGRFEIRGLTGNLVCRNFPLQRVADVKGKVTIEAFTEFGVEGAGTSHHDDIHEITPARSYSVTIDNVTEGVDLKYGRVSLALKNIAGKVDVENEFGDTSFVASGKLSDAAHRIVSQSGRIDVKLSDETWESLPVVAATNYGGIRTNIDQAQFAHFILSGPDQESRIQREWTGFRKVAKDEERFMAVFELLNRFAAVVKGDARASGLDLVTRSGRIVVVRE